MQGRPAQVGIKQGETAVEPGDVTQGKETRQVDLRGLSQIEQQVAPALLVVQSGGFDQDGGGRAAQCPRHR